MGWRVPWTRLVLFDVYVRSTLLFAAPVWAPGELAYTFPHETQGLRPLGLLYRRGLRLLANVPIDTRISVLHTVTCRPPLTLPMGKAVWRYYARLRGGIDIPSSERGVLSVISRVGEWVVSQDWDDCPM